MAIQDIVLLVLGVGKADIYNYYLVFFSACFKQVTAIKSIILHGAPSHLVINTQLAMQPLNGTTNGLSAILRPILYYLCLSAIYFKKFVTFNV